MKKEEENKIKVVSSVTFEKVQPSYS